MEMPGHVHNGVVVLDGGASLPEGAAVRVVCGPKIRVSGKRRRAQLPLVKTGRPGSVALTNARIAEILGEQDIEDRKRSQDAPS
jgi:ribosomal protein L13